MSCDIMLSVESGGKKKEGGMFEGVAAFVFPSNHCVWWSPAFLEMAGHMPADGK